MIKGQKTVTSEGFCIDGLQEIISEPTHILPHSSACFHLTFTNQPNFVLDNGVHPSQHLHYLHSFKYCKFHFKVEYPQPYQHLIYYQNCLSGFQKIQWLCDQKDY